LYWLSYDPNGAPLASIAAGPTWVQWGVVVGIWSMIAMTVYSGYAYVMAALRLIRRM
jgi:hypothetical protein